MTATREQLVEAVVAAAPAWNTHLVTCKRTRKRRPNRSNCDCGVYKMIDALAALDAQASEPSISQPIQISRESQEDFERAYHYFLEERQRRRHSNEPSAMCLAEILGVIGAGCILDAGHDGPCSAVIAEPDAGPTDGEMLDELIGRLSPAALNDALHEFYKSGYTTRDAIRAATEEKR